MKSRAEYNRKYYLANRERILARCKEYRKRNRERVKAADRAWRKANPEKVRAIEKKYRQTHHEKIREKERERDRKRRKNNPEKAREKSRRFRARKKIRMAADPKLYAHYRAVKSAARKRAAAKFATDPVKYANNRLSKRRTYARRMMKAGRGYSPRPQCRVPDWAVKGQHLDARSAFLAVNLTASQRAYARELAIERKAAK